MPTSLFRVVVSALPVMLAGAALASESLEPSTAIPSAPDNLNLSAEFLQCVTDRGIIDAYQIQRHGVEPGTPPATRKLYAAQRSAERYIKVVRSQPPPDANRYRSKLPERFVPLRGYRAPILGLVDQMPPPLALRAEMDGKTIAAAECVARRLAHDGLLSTLAQVIGIFGTDHFTTDRERGTDTLRSIGFPTDLLAYFPVANGQPGKPDDVVAFLARHVSRGTTVKSIEAELDNIPFRFAQTHQPFFVATESGEYELGMLRVQVGGGYDNGIVPGGSIDIISQLVSAFPTADFLISIPNQYLEPYHELASQTWRLRRTNQVTLVTEPLPVGAWAQDNGKAGWLIAESSAISSSTAVPQRPATLAPRYACIDEEQSIFQKGESFLMDGLQAAGHAVVQSPLLFQGGNLLPVRDPKSGRRVLLIGEAELHRNIALGLTHAQALEAFRVEFGVDRCLQVPSVSYHLDFDVCFRAHGGELIAFINDTMAAARAVVGLGLDALQKAGVLDSNAAQTARADLNAGRELETVRSLRTALPRRPTETNVFPASLSRSFAFGSLDSAAGNFQCFLLSLDLLESSAERADDIARDPDPVRAAYVQALRRLNFARQSQSDVFKSQGWKVVAIPSMADLYRGINYLNGIHHREGYVMPAFGGFYAPLDHAATAAFGRVLGPDFKITSILSAESQRHHGGVHCTTSAYPRL
jgi:hypothetical protein